MRLAYFTPLSPLQSGVSAYSEELLRYLADLAEVELVVDGYAPVHPEIAGRLRLIDVSEFLARPDAYDAAVYQVANSFDHHAYMIPAMEACPGILVLHDYCLQYLMLGLTLRRGGLGSLVEILRPAYGARARGLAWKLLLGIEDPNAVLFARPLVEMNRAVIVHSEYARQCVVNDCPAKPVRVVSMGVPLEEPGPVSPDSRRRHGLSEADILLASISTQAYTKRIEIVLEALPRIRKLVPGLKLLIMGGGALSRRAQKLMRRPEIQEAVVRTSWVSDAEYREMIQASDFVIDLRYPSGGETSASLARALAAGKPAIVSAQGTFLELPDDCSVKIPVGPGESDRVVDAVVGLSRDLWRRRQMGDAAKAHARSASKLSETARLYTNFIAEVLAGGAAGDYRPAPWRRCPAPGARAIATLYKICRLGYLIRYYGLNHARRRLAEELRGGPAG